MNKLIPINDNAEQITLSARDLYKFLEATERFSNWFDRNIQYGLEEGIDYVGCKQFNTLARKELQDYQLTIDAAKEISMLQRNEKGREARKYFIELEKAWNTPERIMQRALEVSKKIIEEQNEQLFNQKPKVEFFDQVASSKDAIEMSNVAKVLNIPGFGRNKLFEFLREMKVLQSNNIPYQRYCDSKHFRVVETKYTTPNGEVRISLKTLVYQKGLKYIRNLVNKEKGSS